MRFLFLALVLLTSEAIEASYLYKFTMVRAAPGKLLELIELYRDRMPVYERSGDERPLWMQHAQGDQWDLLLIVPMESLTSYYAPERVSRRTQAADGSGLSDAEFNRRVAECSAFHEDVFVDGPPLPDMRRAAEGAGYFHTEMFVALAGKLDDLRKEREMENAYLKALGRPQTMTFLRVEGAAWDLISLAFYRDLVHFAGSREVPPQKQDEAAKAAGFEDAGHVGSTMRSLIAYHADTIGPILK